jgi:DNA-binding SARP family transcriptional activator
MLRLEALGGLRLVDATGASPAVTQRRRLALLALLACAGERGLTRDKVIGYLWPESTPEHARHGLEQLLYALRQQVPEQLILGPDPLRLNPAQVESDVGGFRRAIASGEWGTAAGLFRGPFLDGFYLSDAPEFERWAEEERKRLHEEHVKALRHLASEAEAQGRHTHEIDIWRRLAEADPLGERSAAGLVRALAGAGDWAGALRFAQEFESRLRREIPGARTGGLVALVEQVRAGRSSGSVHAASSDAGASDAERYIIDRELGRGTVATVYLARDQKHNRPVALKVLKREIASATDDKRFKREIDILARLNHPHLLQLFDSGVLAPTRQMPSLFFVMPYIQGGTLRDRLKREVQLPLETALHIAREVAEALHYAHAQGIVHRDIRPENILLEQGHALVADFGIARILEAVGGESFSTAGLVIGLPGYMSPEQATASRELDGRTDIYSLGSVLYEMLAGQVPFTGATRTAVLARQIYDPVPPLTTLCPTIPPSIERAVVRALAKRPEDRFATGAEFAAALRL